MRQMPTAVEVEKHVLGATLLFYGDCLSLVVERLKEDDFWDPRHALMFAALRDFHSKGIALDFTGLVKALENSERFKSLAGIETLEEMTNEVVSDAGIENHIQIILDCSHRRKMIKVLGDNLERAFDIREPVSEMIERAESSVLLVGSQRESGPKLKSMAEVLTQLESEWAEIASGKSGGLMSGIRPLDDLLGGFRPGKIYVMAARPGLGKSMLALQIATQCRKPVAHYSLEMLAAEQAERMVSGVSGIDSSLLRDFKTLRFEHENLLLYNNQLRHLPIWFCDETPITPAQIMAQARRMKKENGLGLIIVDYLQLINGSGKFERRDLEVGSISKSLKTIAMKLQVPVLTIASLSRKPEERTDKRPLLSDLRESGDIESDADCVMFLYRESDYNAEAKSKFPNVTELIISKNRGGKRGRAIFDFDGAHSKFTELEQHSTGEYLDFIGGKSNATNSRSKYPSQVSNPNTEFYAGK